MSELKLMLQRIIQVNGNFISDEEADLCLHEFKQLQDRLSEAEKVIEFYEAHSKVANDFEEVPTVTIFSFTGINRKNSGSGEIHDTYKRFGKRAREYQAKWKEKV